MTLIPCDFNWFIDRILFTGGGRRLESAVALSNGSVFVLSASSVAAITATYPEVKGCLLDLILVDKHLFASCKSTDLWTGHEEVARACYDAVPPGAYINEL
jgi:hypothetical protein